MLETQPETVYVTVSPRFCRITASSVWPGGHDVLMDADYNIHNLHEVSLVLKSNELRNLCLCGYHYALPAHPSLDEQELCATGMSRDSRGTMQPQVWWAV